MPYARTIKGLRQLRDRRRFEAALSERAYSAAELSRLCGALGTPVSKQALAKLRRGQSRSVRVELANTIERVLAVEPGYLFRIGDGDEEEW